MENVNKDLIDFIKGSPTPFHTVRNVSLRLIEDGYTELGEGESWSLSFGKGYFVKRGDSSLIAFRTPEAEFDGFQISASHTDSPAFKLKPDFEISGGEYIRLNAEKYGGPVIDSFFDRPLSLAGRVIVRESKRFVSRLVSLDDVALIPSVAPHLQPPAQKSVATDLVAMVGSEKGRLSSLIAEAADTDPENVVSHDLFLVSSEKGRVWGAQGEYISAPRLDDLQCVFASLSGFLLSSDEVNMPVLALFDSEEVGSASREGGGSSFLSDTLKRIAFSFGKSEEEYMALLYNSFLVSADSAHAVHPNHPDLTDSANKCPLNSGIVIKRNSQKRYITEGESEAVVAEICRASGVPFTVYTNHSNIQGGATLGHVAISDVSVLGADVGLPLLSMHSIYETGGAMDTEYAIRFFESYFSSHIYKDNNGITIE